MSAAIRLRQALRFPEIEVPSDHTFPDVTHSVKSFCIKLWFPTRTHLASRMRPQVSTCSFRAHGLVDRPCLFRRFTARFRRQKEMGPYSSAVTAVFRCWSIFGKDPGHTGLLVFFLCCIDSAATALLLIAPMRALCLLGVVLSDCSIKLGHDGVVD